ncbi:DUF6134 family protein [Noviherbaspirillum galbum]|uniref:DUF3108 domain-containing protein n=1 Tax=Noviherbaspirillum galbum TaxID=2709383 RepID=A0A6B3SJN6_9BURK|nr:DUF6134 family protein [Noviherbaspirillum galbum]NEX59565.1 hypothetical protein [Noviherbaspirillum galbum]
MSALLLVLSAGAAAEQRTWRFDVQLDGKPIGQHRFILNDGPGSREIRSDAEFDVKFLLVFKYRYVHHAHETWQGDCLKSLRARTDENGTLSSVDAEAKAGSLVVKTDEGSQAYAGCVMTFAYWNPAILKQQKLLNPQTGRYEDVKVSLLQEDELTLGGRKVVARRYRITGPAAPIELWYSPEGDWLQLASTVKGGMQLVYRRGDPS